MTLRIPCKISAFILFSCIWILLSGCGIEQVNWGAAPVDSEHQLQSPSPSNGPVQEGGASGSAPSFSNAPMNEKAEPETSVQNGMVQESADTERTRPADSTDIASRYESTRPAAAGSGTDAAQPESINPSSTEPVNTPVPAIVEGESNNPATDESATIESPPTVTISVRGDDKKGIIIEPTEAAIEDGESVLDVLKRVTKKSKIPMEYRGAGMLSYVEGIGNLYEFDRGPASGWLFKVNGKLMEKSAGAARVNKGDQIEWVYSIELDKGEDSDDPNL